MVLPSVGRVKRDMAEICVKAVLAVADLKRKDVNLDLIKVSIRTFTQADHSFAYCVNAFGGLYTAFL